LRHRQASLRWA